MSLTQTSRSLPHGATAEISRPLTAADIALIPAPGYQANGTPHLKKIREAHHRLAALVAGGCSLKEINEETGYSFSRISILKSDPSFAELVEFYKHEAVERNIDLVVDLQKRIFALAIDAVEELHSLTLDTPELTSPDQKIDIAKFATDRSGHGPQSKSFNLNATLDLAGQVAAGRRRAGQLSAAPAVKPALLQLPNSTGRAARGGDE